MHFSLNVSVIPQVRNVEVIQDTYTHLLSNFTVNYWYAQKKFKNMLLDVVLCSNHLYVIMDWFDKVIFGNELRISTLTYMLSEISKVLFSIHEPCVYFINISTLVRTSSINMKVHGVRRHCCIVPI